MHTTCLLISEDKTMLDRFNYFTKIIYDIILIGQGQKPVNAILAITELKPNLVFIDMDSANMNGYEFLNELNLIINYPALIFISKDEQNAIKAIKLGAFDFLVKPIDLEDLKDTIARFKAQIKANKNKKQINLSPNLSP